MPLDASGRGGLPRGDRLHLPVRAHYHPATKAHRADPRGARRAHGLQYPRARWSIPAQPPLHLVGAYSLEVGAADRRDACRDCRSSAPSSSTAPRAGTSRRRSGPFTVFDVRPGHVAAATRTPADYGLRRLHARPICAGGDARAQRAGAQGGAARRGPRRRTATACCSGPHWRSKWRARSGPRARASRAPRRRSTAAPRRASSRDSSAPVQGRRGSVARERVPGADGARQPRAQSPPPSAPARSRDCRRRCAAVPPPPPLRLDPSGFDLIAELKLRSPAAGPLRASDEDVSARVGALRARRCGCGVGAHRAQPLRWHARAPGGGARALHPLRVPAMRKDFLVDPYQVLEARARRRRRRARHPADAATRADRGAARVGARRNGLFVLLEAFDAEDIAPDARAGGARRRRHAQLLGGRQLPRPRHAEGRAGAARRARAAPAARRSRASPRAASRAPQTRARWRAAGYELGARRQRADGGR